MRAQTYTRAAISVLLVTASAALLPRSAAAATPEQIIGQIAESQTHSWVDNGLPVSEMVERVTSGRRLFVSCGYVSEVTRRVLRENGHTARVVGSVTLDDLNGFTDGHAMLEVFQSGRWQLYDVDANVRAVDAQGAGVSLVKQVAAVREGRALWESIADDPLFREDEPDPVLRKVARDVFTDPEAFYRRVMGSALLPRDPQGSGSYGMYYVDSAQDARVAAHWSSVYFRASPDAWNTLVTSTEAVTAPVTAETSSPPVPAAPLPAAPAVIAEAAPRTVKRRHARKCRARKVVRRQWARGRPRLVRCRRARWGGGPESNGRLPAGSRALYR